MAYCRALLCVAVVFMGAACGDSDDGDGDNTENDGGLDGGDSDDSGPRRNLGRDDGGTGGSGGDPGNPSNDAAVGTGDGEEGVPCETIADCTSELSCVNMGRFTIGFCARSCRSDADCGRESCLTFTGDPADAHCVNFEREEYASCGEAFTALCADRTCLTFPDLPFGVCVDICTVEEASSDNDAGTPDEDAGAGNGGEGGGDPQLASCGEDQVCAGGILVDPTQGICGMVVGRGEECGIDVGLFCEGTDICSRDDPESEDPPVCRQDCSNRETCDDGTTCTDFRGQFAVCL